MKEETFTLAVQNHKKNNFEIARDLYEKILKTRKKDSIISSNTSTIPLKVLSAKMSNEDKKDFCITHFFNPVRYMGLLEIVKESFNDLDKINFLKINLLFLLKMQSSPVFMEAKEF